MEQQVVGLRDRLLAQTKAVPRVDADGYVGARVLRPLTALVVAVDPEKGYSTPEKCALRKAEMIEEIIRSVHEPIDLDDLRRDVEVLVQVRTWPNGCFEFSHFTDRELARAMRRLVKGAAPPLEEVQAAIADTRHRHLNLDRVWTGWSRKPSKPALAEALIPELIRKVDRKAKPPLVDAINEAIRLGRQAAWVREVAVRA